MGLPRSMDRILKRADFLAARDGRRVARVGFALQCRERSDLKPGRIGFTVTKRTGNAVERNRIRRRLREVMTHCVNGFPRNGHDYVVIGRRDALTQSFDLLIRDMKSGLSQVHGLVDRTQYRQSAPAAAAPPEEKR